jgi:hemerythrin superfamily protein
MATDQGMGPMPHMGMEVCTADGETVGTVKEMQGRYFKVDAPMKPDFWLTTDCIRTASANTVTLTVDKNHLGDVKTDLPAQREAQSPYTTTTTNPVNSASRPTATGSVAGADIGQPLGRYAERGAAWAQGQAPASVTEPVGAIALLMQMHTEAKTQFTQILNSASNDQAELLWRKLQPVLKVHEEMEERYLYDPLKAEQGRGTELGDWEPQHEHEVEAVNALIAQADDLSPSDGRWLPQLRQIRDTLARHIDEEETMIFPRIQQVWDRDRLERAGQQMQQMKQQRLGGMS